MNKNLFILIACLALGNMPAVKSFGHPLQHNSLQPSRDTNIVENLVKEDTLISEVVKSKKAPAKKNVQYFSQVTRYGFKNLFSYYDYNPSLPYTAQVNPNAESFIQDYVKAHNASLQKMKGWCQPYFNLIETILEQYGLPHELKYIAVIESNLKSGAVSNKGACGPWQLMPETARRLGLTIKPYNDERTDYYKSTNAAARYLLSLYGQFHDWLLVMAAYNGGTNNVLNAMQKSGSNNFWSLQFYLPEESRNYVKRFIATHYIMEGNGDSTVGNLFTDSASNYMEMGSASRTSYGQSKGVNPYNNSPALSDSEKAGVQQLTISGKYYASVIAKNISMEIGDFNHYNPGFDNMISTDGSYNLRLPADKMQLFVANKYPILNQSVEMLLGGTNIPDNKTSYPKHAVKAKKTHQ